MAWLHSCLGGGSWLLQECVRPESACDTALDLTSTSVQELQSKALPCCIQTKCDQGGEHYCGSVLHSMTDNTAHVCRTSHTPAPAPAHISQTKDHHATFHASPNYSLQGTSLTVVVPARNCGKALNTSPSSNLMWISMSDRSVTHPSVLSQQCHAPPLPSPPHKASIMLEGRPISGEEGQQACDDLLSTFGGTGRGQSGWGSAHQVHSHTPSTSGSWPACQPRPLLRRHGRTPIRTASRLSRGSGLMDHDTATSLAPYLLSSPGHDIEPEAVMNDLRKQAQGEWPHAPPRTNPHPPPRPRTPAASRQSCSSPTPTPGRTHLARTPTHPCTSTVASTTIHQVSATHPAWAAQPAPQQTTSTTTMTMMCA